VRSASSRGSGGASKGEASPPQCVTPRDSSRRRRRRARGRADAGQISLIWDANTEKDLAGYLVLRGEAPTAAGGDHASADQGNVVS
jgi:hypothetical protein